MNANGLTCPNCGAASRNPAAGVCAFCNSPLGAPPPAAGYGAPPQGYGAPPAFGPPGYGAPQLPPAGAYGQPPGYGAPPYGAASPYGAPQQGPYGTPYGYPPGYGAPPAPTSFWSSFLSSGWSIFWLIRLGIAVLVVMIVAASACVSALMH